MSSKIKERNLLYRLNRFSRSFSIENVQHKPFTLYYLVLLYCVILFVITILQYKP